MNEINTLTTQNKIIFATAFVAMNILCTWLVLEIGAMI